MFFSYRDDIVYFVTRAESGDFAARDRGLKNVEGLGKSLLVGVQTLFLPYYIMHV